MGDNLPAAVECRALRKVYPGRRERGRRGSDVTAVDGIDLKVDRGVCFGLLGPNGAGKTTTVELLEGLQPPTAGTVALLGRPWHGDGDELRQRIGVALQETRFSERLTVEETLELFRSFYRRPRALEDVMADVELQEKRGAQVGKLSGGQRQRLALACALTGNPEVLFLDEPTTGLDPQSRRRVWELVTRYRADGGTVLLTTHYMDEAEVLCDRVAVVDHGRIISEGSPRQLIAALGAEHVIELELRHGAVPDEQALRAVAGVRDVRREAERWQVSAPEPHVTMPALLEYLRSAGLELARLETRHATLEDVFVSLTGRHLRDG